MEFKITICSHFELHCASLMFLVHSNNTGCRTPLNTTQQTVSIQCQYYYMVTGLKLSDGSALHCNHN